MAILKLKPDTNNHTATNYVRPSFKDLKRVILHTNGCIEIIEMKDIEYIKADGNYSVIHLVNGTKKIVTKTLKSIIPSLDETFIRTHKSYVVNMRYIKRYNTKDSEIQMKSDDSVHVSRTKKQLLKELFY